MAGRWMHTPHPTPMDPPLAISYRNHYASGMFQSFGTITFFFFTERQSQKGGAVAQCPPSLNTLLHRILKLGACERIISSFKGV